MVLIDPVNIINIIHLKWLYCKVNEHIEVKEYICIKSYRTKRTNADNSK